MIKKITNAITPLKHVDKINEIIDKFNVFYKRQVGEILPIVASDNYVPDGTLPCDGAEYAKTQFSDLWNNYLTGELETVSTFMPIEGITKNGKSYVFDCTALSSDDNLIIVFSFTTGNDVNSEQILFSLDGQPIVLSGGVINYTGTFDSSEDEIFSINVSPNTTYSVEYNADSGGFLITIDDNKLCSINSIVGISSLVAGSASFKGSFDLSNGFYNSANTNYNETPLGETITETKMKSMLNTCTYTEYETDIATYGQCAKFAVDTDNETFRVPLIKDTETVVTNNIDYDNGVEIGCPISTAPFTAPCDGVYITTITKSNTEDYLYVNGVKTSFYRQDATGGESWDNFFVPLSKGDVIYWGSVFTAVSSKFYPYKEETKEKLKSFVVVANGQTNQSLIDWSAWASSLQGKANIDLSNCTSPIVAAPYIVEVSDKSISPSWYRVWSDGWCEQGGQLGSASATSYTVTFLKTFIDTNYALLATDSTGTDSHSDTGGASDTVFLGDKKTSSFRVSIASSRQQSSWEAKGYIS